MTKWFAKLFRTVACVSLAALFFPLVASAQDQVVSSPVFRSPAQVQTFWTPERLANAKPMPMPTLSGAPRLGTLAEAEAVSGATMLVTSANPGGRFTKLSGASAEQALAEASAPAPLFNAGNFAFARYRLFPNTTNQYKQFPYRTIGKLFFQIPGQGLFVCSASVTSATNRSVVWTAGHCVYSPGIGFHNSFVFIPARREGTTLTNGAPYGTWTALQAFTTAQWTGGALEFDHGALVMNRGGTSGTAKIQDAVGSLGFLANASRNQQWTLHGYPQAPRDLGSTPPGAQFDGEHHEICLSSFGATDDPSGDGGGKTNGVGCDKTGGTSGGPWLVDFSGFVGATDLLNGNNSYRYTGPNPPENLKLFSPHFASAAVALRNTAEAVNVP